MEEWRIVFHARPTVHKEDCVSPLHETVRGYVLAFRELGRDVASEKQLVILRELFGKDGRLGSLVRGDSRLQVEAGNGLGDDDDDDDGDDDDDDDDRPYGDNDGDTRRRRLDDNSTTTDDSRRLPSLDLACTLFKTSWKKVLASLSRHALSNPPVASFKRAPKVTGPSTLAGACRGAAGAASFGAAGAAA